MISFMSAAAVLDSRGPHTSTKQDVTEFKAFRMQDGPGAVRTDERKYDGITGAAPSVTNNLRSELADKTSEVGRKATTETCRYCARSSLPAAAPSTLGEH
jgi:hypothetical protein